MKPTIRPMRTAKFTDEEVIGIRDRAAKYERSVREEAEAFGVAPETIRKIIRRDTFTWLGGGGYKGIKPTVRIPKEQQEEIDAEAAESQERIMKKLAADIKRVPVPDRLLAELQAMPTESAAEKIRRLSGEGPPAGPLDGD